MRFLAGFVVVCVLMLGVVVWHLMGGGKADASSGNTVTSGRSPDVPSSPAADGPAETTVDDVVRCAENPLSAPTRTEKGFSVQLGDVVRCAENPFSAPIRTEKGFSVQRLTDLLCRESSLGTGLRTEKGFSVQRSFDEEGASAEAAPSASSRATSSTPAAEPIVRWAADPATEHARRRLELADAALRDEPYREPALRDKVAALSELRRWHDAADTLTRLVELHPDDTELRFELATMLMRSRRWFDATTALKVVVAREPAHARAWFNLAVAHQALGHLADARRAWDCTIELSPHAAAFARRGEVLLDLHEWAAAGADFETVLEQQPDAPDATLNLALAWWKLGRVEEARRRLLGFLEAHPRHVPTLNRLADMAWAACRAAPAEDQPRCIETVNWCRRSLEIDPQQPAVQALLEAALEAGQDDH